MLDRSDGVYDQLLFFFAPGIDRVEGFRTTVVQPRNGREDSNTPRPNRDPVRLGDGERHLRIVVRVVLREIRRELHITEVE